MKQAAQLGWKTLAVEVRKTGAGETETAAAEAPWSAGSPAAERVRGCRWVQQTEEGWGKAGSARLRAGAARVMTLR